jgi:hypothetical protein
MRRLPDLAVFVGVLCLAAAIGEGRSESAKARARHDPLLWQLQVFAPDGELLRSQEVVGNENLPLAVADPVSQKPQLQLSILPLGLPDGGLDVQLSFAVNGAAIAPLQGFKVTPGETIHLDVPGQPYRLALRATRIGERRPLVS